ncbi:hypothetical protein [Rubritalea marina]|uniref:hypothetical protein n=1 Tax=Rubritalea marina TaxID=361055 RepID=UPI00035C958B|nr:hypothetical protein [Rubritalea marina]
MIKKTTLAAAAAITLSTSASQAIEIAPLQTGYIYDFSTNIDGGGEVSSHFFHLSGSRRLQLESRRVFVRLNASYYNNSYNFSGGPIGSLSQVDPWDSVHTFNLGASVLWRMTDEWNLFFLPTVRSAGESGASFSDTLTAGALLGASYRFNDKLSIGPGVGYVGQIEDSASVFPILVIDWKLTDSLTLSTGTTVGATLGPGLSLKWDIKDDLRFTVGARAERTRFRLSSDNPALQNGIGEDNSIPVYGILTYQWTDLIQTSLLAGVGVSNDFVVDDANGNRLTRQDYDPSPFLGINVGFVF